MSEGAEQDKSELPTSYKLERARREGTVARGMDLGFVSVLVTLTAAVWLTGERLVGAVSRSPPLGRAATDADLVGAPGLRALTAQLMEPISAALLPVLGGLFFVVLAIEFIQTGPVFSTRAFRFDFNRLNPAGPHPRRGEPGLYLGAGPFYLE